MKIEETRYGVLYRYRDGTVDIQLPPEHITSKRDVQAYAAGENQMPSAKDDNDCWAFRAKCVRVRVTYEVVDEGEK